MTAPKHYEDMAEGWACDTGCLCNMHKDDLVEALRTAAREAQVRVLEAAQDMLIFENRAFRALVTLKERIEKGEDL